MNNYSGEMQSMADITEPVAPMALMQMKEFQIWLQHQKEFNERVQQQQQMKQQHEQMLKTSKQQQQTSVDNRRNRSFGETLADDQSEDDEEEEEETAIGDFTPPSQKAIEDLLEVADKTPLIQQMGFRSYSIPEDRREYNKRRQIASKALAAKPTQFIVGSPWKSVKSKTTRQILINKVKEALSEYKYSDSVALAIIISLTNNNRRNRNRGKNRDIKEKGGTVKRGRPATHGYYSGRRKKSDQGVGTNDKAVPAVAMQTTEDSGRTSSNGQTTGSTREYSSNRGNTEASESTIDAPRKRATVPPRKTLAKNKVASDNNNRRVQPVEKPHEVVTNGRVNVPRKKPMSQNRVASPEPDITTYPPDEITNNEHDSIMDPVSQEMAPARRLPAYVANTNAVAQPVAVNRAEKGVLNIMSIGTHGNNDQASIPLLPKLPPLPKHIAYRLNPPKKQVPVPTTKAQPVQSLKTLEIYTVVVGKRRVQYQFSLNYQEFRKKWNDKDVWYRFPGGNTQVLLDDEERYNQFLSRVRTHKEAPTLWVHTEAEFNDDDGDDDSSLYSMPPPQPMSKTTTTTGTKSVSFASSHVQEENIRKNTDKTPSSNTLPLTTDATVTTNSTENIDKAANDVRGDGGDHDSNKKTEGPKRGRQRKAAAEPAKPRTRYPRKAAGTAKPKATPKEKAPRKTASKAKKHDTIQENIDSMSSVISWDQTAKETAPTTAAAGASTVATTGAAVGTVVGIPSWEYMDSSQIPPPSCGQPLLAPVTQRDPYNPTPPCAQPQPSTQMSTQVSTQSTFYPTQDPIVSFSSAAPPRTLPEMCNQTQDYIREDGFDIAQLTGLEDVFTNRGTTPPRVTNLLLQGSQMESGRHRKQIGRLSPAIRQSSQLQSSQLQPSYLQPPHLQYPQQSFSNNGVLPNGAPILQVPASSYAPQVGHRYAVRNRHPPQMDINGQDAQRPNGTTVERVIGLPVNYQVRSNVNNVQSMGGEGRYYGPKDNQGAMGPPMGAPNIPNLSGYQRTKQLLQTASNNTEEAAMTPAKRGNSGGLSNAQKKVKLAAFNRHLKNGANLNVVPETPGGV